MTKKKEDKQKEEKESLGSSPKITIHRTGCTIETKIDIFFPPEDDDIEGGEFDDSDWVEGKERQGYIVLVDDAGTKYMIHAKDAKFLGGGLTKEEFLEMAGEGRWLPE